MAPKIAKLSRQNDRDEKGTAEGTCVSRTARRRAPSIRATFLGSYQLKGKPMKNRLPTLFLALVLPSAQAAADPALPAAEKIVPDRLASALPTWDGPQIVRAEQELPRKIATARVE